MVNERLQKARDVVGLQIDDAAGGEDLARVDEQLQGVLEDLPVGDHAKRWHDLA